MYIHYIYKRTRQTHQIWRIQREHLGCTFSSMFEMHCLRCLDKTTGEIKRLYLVSHLNNGGENRSRTHREGEEWVPLGMVRYIVSYGLYIEKDKCPFLCSVLSFGVCGQSDLVRRLLWLDASNFMQLNVITCSNKVIMLKREHDEFNGMFGGRN